MRVFLKICLIALGVVALVPIMAFAWVFFDSEGLPDVQSLAQFSPSTLTQVSDPCLRTAMPGAVAVPYDSIGSNLREALSVAELVKTILDC